MFFPSKLPEKKERRSQLPWRFIGEEDAKKPVEAQPTKRIEDLYFWLKASHFLTISRSNQVKNHLDKEIRKIMEDFKLNQWNLEHPKMRS